MRARCAASGAGPARFYRDDRFVATDSLGDARKAAWIAERFQVKKNNFGARLFFPILQQIIARDIRFVADAYEAGKSNYVAALGL
jgi:hypothetical protein